MRSTASLPVPAPSAAPRRDREVLAKLLPYFWQYRWRVGVALLFMLGAKLATVGVPLLLKELVDRLEGAAANPLFVLPVGLLAAYGLLRLSTSLLTEARELIFAKATEGAARQISLQVFRHLHDLSLRFHLERQTGGMTRDIERGTRAVHSLISYSLYSILPTFIEVLLVLGLLGAKFDGVFVAITGGALLFYVVYTISVTEWRTKFRRQLNEIDSATHTQAVDSLLNYETVKYFGAEDFEARRYDASLERLRQAQLKSQTTLSLLNTGQQLVIAAALIAMLWRATQGVVDGRLSLGDLVMINAFMIQLYMPLNFLGVLYREIKQSLTDLDRLFGLLGRHKEVADTADAAELRVAGGRVEFDAVDFAYDPARPVLHQVSFAIEPGQRVAVVGPSGSGKSTLARLLFRFYDVQQGAIRIDGQDIRAVSQHSLRLQLGIVPQDAVLFNDSIAYNIGYAKEGAGQAEIEAAAGAAQLDAFIRALPQGYATRVGERGLKLSGGEKQRVAIARTLLKNPPILIFDEATSALDSHNERAIQAQLDAAGRDKTVLVIAHRLSTVVDADQILVLDAGRIVERGRHAELLARGGAYARMWALQVSEQQQKKDDGNQVA